MVSVVAVAAHAGVSPATVSRVIAGRVPVAAETRARVLEAVERLGYRPNEVARSLRVGRGRAVALVTGDIEQGIYAALAKHVQGELEALGLDLLLFNLGHREDRLRHFLERAPSLGLRGIVLSSPHVMDMDGLMPVIETATKSGVEILSVSQDLSPFGITSIIHDDGGGAASAVAHLLARGSAPIAFVGRIETSAIGRARFDGYRGALLAHGQTLDPALVWDISEGYRADAGYRAASEALANGLRFRAVLAASSPEAEVLSASLPTRFSRHEALAAATSSNSGRQTRAIPCGCIAMRRDPCPFFSRKTVPHARFNFSVTGNCSWIYHGF